MDDALEKFVERATDVLVEFAKKEKKDLLSVDDAAKEFLENKKDFKSFEAKFNVNMVDVLYHFLKDKYKEIAASEKAEDLLTILKSITEKTDKDSIEKAKLVHQQLLSEMKKIEDNILKEYPDYKKRF